MELHIFNNSFLYYFLIFDWIVPMAASHTRGNGFNNLNSTITSLAVGNLEWHGD